MPRGDIRKKTFLFVICRGEFLPIEIIMPYTVSCVTKVYVRHNVELCTYSR